MITTVPTAGVLAQTLLLGTLTAAAGLGPAGWLAGTTYGMAVGLLLTVGLRQAGTRRPGPADMVTLARSVLVGCVTALVVDNAGQPIAVVVAITAVALALDAVDGKVARFTRTESRLGARFDMEVDAFLILVLSLVVARWLGLWVLASGLMRYSFVAASWALPWLNRPLPPSVARKRVAAFQGIALLVAASQLLPRPTSSAITATALTLLTWSFARDIWWLARHRGDDVPDDIPVRNSG